MSTNAIRWVRFTKNYSGKPKVMICRTDGMREDATLPDYRATPASAKRVIRMLEDESRDHVISIDPGSGVSRMSIMLHARLKRLPKSV